MKIVIIGDGKVGYKLAKALSAEDYDVVLIDSNEEKLMEAMNRLDIMCIPGEGGSAEVQKNAGVPDTAWFPEKQALTDYVISQIQKGDILWVKGSHGMALETLIEAIYKQP